MLPCPSIDSDPSLCFYRTRTLITTAMQNTSLPKGWRPQHRAAQNPAYTRIPIQGLLNAPDGETKQAPQFQEVKCEYPSCRKKFATPQALINHRSRQHGSPSAIVCPHCSSSFSTVPNLNKHVSDNPTHFNEPVSWFVLKMHSSLTFQQRRSVHEKEKSFSCDQCTSSFAFKDGLTRHILMVHNNIRPFKCLYCSLTFKSTSHRNKHILSIHPENNSRNAKKM